MAPDAPTGCPRAIAPPLGWLLLDQSLILSTAQAWAANASVTQYSQFVKYLVRRV